MEKKSPISLLFSDNEDDWKMCILMISRDQKTFNEYFEELSTFYCMQLMYYFTGDKVNSHSDRVTNYLVEFFKNDEDAVEEIFINKNKRLFNKYYKKWKEKYGK